MWYASVVEQGAKVEAELVVSACLPTLGGGDLLRVVWVEVPVALVEPACLYENSDGAGGRVWVGVGFGQLLDELREWQGHVVDGQTGGAGGVDYAEAAGFDVGVYAYDDLWLDVECHFSGSFVLKPTRGRCFGRRSLIASL